MPERELVCADKRSFMRMFKSSSVIAAMRSGDTCSASRKMKERVPIFTDSRSA